MAKGTVNRPDAAALNGLLEREQLNVAGVIVRLAWQQGLTREEIAAVKDYAFRINELLKGYMKEIGIDLVDFKLEFGKTADGVIVLADEISPDTCRLWDSATRDKLDKDRFRRDMGGAEKAYIEVMRRLMEEN